MLPRALDDLIEAFGDLPGIGPKNAERLALSVLKNPVPKAKNLAKNLDEVHANVKKCSITFALIDADEEVSSLYSDPSRDKSIIAVVEDPFDLVAIEKTELFKGTYHVLGGNISPIDGITPEHLHIPELIERIKNDEVKEIILATSAGVEGESTALYIQKQLEDLEVKITRLARGIPVGVDLEYADQITLTHALNGRTEL
jgi:recombination protein RecR